MPWQLSLISGWKELYLGRGWCAFDWLHENRKMFFLFGLISTKLTFQIKIWQRTTNVLNCWPGQTKWDPSALGLMLYYSGKGSLLSNTALGILGWEKQVSPRIHRVITLKSKIWKWSAPFWVWRLLEQVPRVSPYCLMLCQQNQLYGNHIFI